MRIGISTSTFFLREESENAIVKIKELGAECAELFFSTYYEYRPEFAKAHRGLAEGLEIYSIHALSTSFEPQLFSDSRRVRGDGFYWLDQVLRSAQLFGAKKYSFHGYISRAAGAVDYDKIAGYMRDICDFSARYGIDICLENVCWCMYERPGIFKELKNRCPRLAAVLDVKQARRSGYPLNMYIADTAGSVSHVHLSDVDENGAICLPGKGLYDFEEIFRRLHGSGFDGPAIIEVYSQNYGGYSELKQSLDYLNEIIYKLNF